MTPLDLNRLNVYSPYSVWNIADGVYAFKTNHGVLYRIYFLPDQTIWQSGAYEFGLVNDNKKPSPADRHLRATVICIIEEFFRLNPDILLYQCETGDNRQATRDRLFLRWFKEYAHNDRYVIKIAKVIAEGIDNYAAIIVQRSNPHLNSIIHDFDQFIGLLQNKPF